MISSVVLLLLLAGEPGGGESACIMCHKNLPGRLSGVIEEWKQSVHYANKVTCDSCHGGDPKLRREQFPSEEAFKRRSHLRSDGRVFGLDRSSRSFTATVRGRSISYFCGACHDAIKEKHLGSPHGTLGEPSCLYCHGRGSHAIGHPAPTIVDPRSRAEEGRCALCHRAATMETVATIRELLTEAESNLTTAMKQYEWLKAQKYKKMALDRMYEHSKETRSRLRQTFHSFNMRDITNFASAIKSNAELTQQTYDMITKLEKAKKTQAIAGLGVVFLLLLFAGVLLYYRKTVLEHG